MSNRCINIISPTSANVDLSTYVTYETLVATSGVLYQEILEVAAAASSNVIGSAFFNVAGTTIEHNINTINHFTAITPLVSTNEEAAALGTTYVTLGPNSDIVYNTGDEEINSLPFKWLVTLSGTISGSGGGGGGCDVTKAYVDSLVATTSGALAAQIFTVDGRVDDWEELFFGLQSFDTLTFDYPTTSGSIDETYYLDGGTF